MIPKVAPNSSRIVLKLFPKYFQLGLTVSPNYAQTIPELIPSYPLINRKLSPSYLKTRPQKIPIPNLIIIKLHKISLNYNQIRPQIAIGPKLPPTIRRAPESVKGAKGVTPRKPLALLGALKSHTFVR